MFLGREISRLIKDCLFPIFCLECRTEGQWWCENCLKKITTIGVYYCPVCHISNIDGKSCNHCKAVSPLNGVAAFLDYNDQAIIGQLIKQYKYNFAFDISNVWDKMAALFLFDIIKKMNIDVNDITIIPIPLHTKRERGRGFNQADLIAQIVYNKINEHRKVKFDNRSLQRKRFTQQQAKLNRTDRLENLKNAFEWCNQNSVSKCVLLVDDVFTSGATMQECAGVLKQFGAQKVYGFTLARD